MRKIKFRGFNKDLGKWFYGYLFILPDGRHFIRQVNDMPDKFGNAFFDMIVETESVGEFTGLKDKNGKEIFEGDIVEYCNGNRSVVEYKESEFEDGDCIGFAIHSNLKVIGNKFENPELLEEKNEKINY